MANFDEIIAKAHKGNRNCQLIVGEHYLNKGNLELASEWLAKAADNEDPKAQYHLSFLYFKGAGVVKDFVKAADYLKRSAENDYVPAQTQLGSLYIQGQGVAQDEQMGLFWSRKAAAAGSEIAMFNLGVAYFRGIGMSKNIDKSRDYLLRALKNGYDQAGDILINESELFRSDQDDSDDKDYMKKIVDSIRKELAANKKPDKDDLPSELVIEEDDDNDIPYIDKSPDDDPKNNNISDDDNDDFDEDDEDEDDDDDDDEDDEDEDDEDESELAGEGGADSAKGSARLKNSDGADEAEDDADAQEKESESFFTKLKKFLHKMFAE